MKIKISGILSFVGGIGWGLFGFFLIIENGIDYLEDNLIFSAIIISAISTVLYVIWTNFGDNKLSELEKIDYENQILKKQIEQKELKEKLDD